MDFTPTEEQRALQSAVRDLASSLTPKDTGSGAPAGPQPFDADAWGKLAEMGLALKDSPPGFEGAAAYEDGTYDDEGDAAFAEDEQY